jgi:hypothetical protein
MKLRRFSAKHHAPEEPTIYRPSTNNIVWLRGFNTFSPSAAMSRLAGLGRPAVAKAQRPMPVMGYLNLVRRGQMNWLHFVVAARR